MHVCVFNFNINEYAYAMTFVFKLIMRLDFDCERIQKQVEILFFFIHLMNADLCMYACMHLSVFAGVCVGLCGFVYIYVCCSELFSLFAIC